MRIFKKKPSVKVPKSNCLACGKENDHDSNYCKHCGAQAEPETEKVPEHTKVKRSRNKIIAVLSVVMIIIVIISIIFIYNYEDVDEKETYTYSPTNTPDSLKIELGMNNASVEIQFTTKLSEPVVKIDYQKNWRGIVAEKSSFETSLSKVTFKGSRVYGEADSKLKVILRSDVEYDIYGSVSSGSIALNTEDQGVTLGTVDLRSYSGSTSIVGTDLIITEKIKLRTESGSISVNLIDCKIEDIDGTFNSGSSTIKLENCTMEDIHVDGKSGSVSIISKNAIIDSRSSWTFDVDKGSVGLNIEQSNPLDADVTVDVSLTGNKDIKADFNGNAIYIRAKFSGNKVIDIKESTGFDIIDSKTLESSNFENLTLGKFEIKMTADKGDLEVDVSNL